MTKLEIWKDIVGYQGLYKISSLGRVNSYHRNKEKILSATYSVGYLRVGLSKNGDCEIKLLHRLLAMAFIPNPNNKPHINHINSVRDDNRLENIEWCTPKENVNHAIAKGRLNKKGEKCNLAKLKSNIVLEIREKYKTTKTTYRKLGIKYNLHYTTIGLIVNNKRWKHI